jgi:Right handed beta helix region
MMLKRRWLWVLLFLSVAVAAATLVALPWAVERSGRTPGEFIDYLKLRLSGHPKLEFVALPVLHTVRHWMGEPDEVERATPFAVPPLAPNPVVALAADAATAADDPRVIRVGPNRTIRTVALAARMARPGSIIEIDPGDYVAGIAVWEHDGLVIRRSPAAAAGAGRVRIIAAGTSAEGKGLWVVRARRVTIEDIEFIGTRVPDSNGAGIRLERGQLTVRRCSFHDNETSVLTSSDPEGELVIENSQIGWHGWRSGLAHSIYVGRIASFRLSGSWVHHNNIGHLVKSRARVNRIEYNRLTDEAGGRASYELEFPDGGAADVVGNLIQQGRDTRNSVMVSYGTESLHWPQNRLRFAHNTVVNDHPWGGTFLRAAMPSQVLLRNNLWVGRGRIDAPGADAAGDSRAEPAELLEPQRADYRLGAATHERLATRPLAPLDAALVPRAQYAHPASTRLLQGPVRVPGALQAGGG